MAGSVFQSDGNDPSYYTSTLNISDLVSPNGGSFDLIKCDLEGAEWDFMTHYSFLFRNTKFLVMEWHSWHSGGKGFSQIEKKLTDLEFEIVNLSSPQKAIGRDGEVGLFLAQNLNFQN
jgi:hypothetical protein